MGALCAGPPPPDEDIQRERRGGRQKFYTDDEVSVIIGPQELLEWLSSISGTPCLDVEDIGDGKDILRAFSVIFPKVADLDKLKLLRAPNLSVMPDSEENKNAWNAVLFCMRILRLPATPLIEKYGRISDPHALYQLLVLLFLLHSMLLLDDVDVGFRYPIDMAIHEFLGSQEAIQTLIRGGAYLATKPQSSALGGPAAPVTTPAYKKKEFAPLPPMQFIEEPTQSMLITESKLRRERINTVLDDWELFSKEKLLSKMRHLGISDSIVDRLEVFGVDGEIFCTLTDEKLKEMDISNKSDHNIIFCLQKEHFSVHNQQDQEVIGTEIKAKEHDEEKKVVSTKLSRVNTNWTKELDSRVSIGDTSTERVSIAPQASASRVSVTGLQKKLQEEHSRTGRYEELKGTIEEEEIKIEKEKEKNGNNLDTPYNTRRTKSPSTSSSTSSSRNKSPHSSRSKSPNSSRSKSPSSHHRSRSPKPKEKSRSPVRHQRSKSPVEKKEKTGSETFNRTQTIPEEK